MTAPCERFQALINLPPGEEDPSGRAEWALRSAVALGASSAAFSGATPSARLLRLAEALRMPVVTGDDDRGDVLAVPAALPAPGYCRRRLPPTECNLTSPAVEALFAPWSEAETPDTVAPLAAALRQFRTPVGFDATLRLIQIAQAHAGERAARALRAEGRARAVRVAALGRDVPFATLDPDGGWRPLHYRLRHALAPAVIDAGPASGDGVLPVHVANRRREPLTGVLRWRIARLDGLLLDEGATRVAATPEGVAEAVPVPLSGILRHYPRGQIVVWLALEPPEGGPPLARDMALLAPPKALALQDPTLSVECESVQARSAKGTPEWRRGFRLLFPGDADESETQRDGGHWFRVTLTALSPALWAWLETPGLDGIHFGDNFLHLESETPVEILVRSERMLTLRAFRKALVARSLFDTCVEP